MGWGSLIGRVPRLPCRGGEHVHRHPCRANVNCCTAARLHGQSIGASDMEVQEIRPRDERRTRAADVLHSPDGTCRSSTVRAMQAASTLDVCEQGHGDSLRCHCTRVEDKLEPWSSGAVGQRDGTVAASLGGAGAKRSPAM